VIPLNNALTEHFRNIIKCVHHNLVFIKNNKPIKSIRETFAKVCREAEVEDFTYHDFRHTFVTRKRREGHDPIKIMKVAGHKTVSMYLRYNLLLKKRVEDLKYRSDGHQYRR
jgi:integrase